MTNKSQSGDRSYTATEPQWKSTIDMMEKSSTEQQIFKEGDSRDDTIKSYRQVEAHREPVYRDTHQEVDREVYQAVDQDSTEAAYRERNDEVGRMVTEADVQRRRLVKQHLRVNATYR
jgi:hypothetical protein